MQEVQQIMQGVVSNYQDIDGLMKAQFKLAQLSYTMAEDYSLKRKKAKLLIKMIANEETNAFLGYNMEKGTNTTTAKAVAKNEVNEKFKKEVDEIINYEATYKGNDVEIRQINKFISAINQQVACLRQERQQSQYSQTT